MVIFHSHIRDVSNRRVVLLVVRPGGSRDSSQRLSCTREPLEQPMKAVTWHGRRDVRVDEVPDPRLQAPKDIIVKVTSTGICGSDLHLYELLGPFMGEGDILGHEPMGVVQEVGSEVTEVRDRGMGAALFGYTKRYGEVPGGQAEYLRVPFGDTLPIKVPDGPPDDRFVYLSDVLPTAWQAVRYAAVHAGGSLAVLGLGPIGDMCTRVARHQGIENVIGIDLVPERL